MIQIVSDQRGQSCIHLIEDLLDSCIQKEPSQCHIDSSIFGSRNMIRVGGSVVVSWLWCARPLGSLFQFQHQAEENNNA